MAGYICINCNSGDVTRRGDDFFCDRCKFDWNVAHERACAIYLRGQGREPAKSMAEMAAEASEALIETMGEDGAPEVTNGDPVNVSPADAQSASGELEKLPEVPKGKKGG